MKKTTITSIIAAAFSFVAFETVQAEEHGKSKDWESGLIAKEAEADSMKTQAGGCHGHCGGNNEDMRQQGDKPSFPEGAVDRIVVPEGKQ